MASIALDYQVLRIQRPARHVMIEVRHRQRASA
jgi:hypothetical protein